MTENKDHTHNHEESNSKEVENNDTVKFTCPTCGEITRDDVMFLCNTCDTSELINKDGIYMCPSCLGPGENFECLACESKEVKMSDKK